MASDTQLAGYADRASIRPGEPLHLFVDHDAPSYTVRAYRLGWYGGVLARLVSTSPVLRGTVQRARRLDSRRMVTTSWRRSATLDTPAGRRAPTCCGSPTAGAWASTSP